MDSFQGGTEKQRAALRAAGDRYKRSMPPLTLGAKVK
jgi:hypothetical protein